MTQSELTPLTEPRPCGAPSQSCCASAVSEWWSPKQRNPLDSKEAGIDRVFYPLRTGGVLAPLHVAFWRHGR